MFGPFPFGQPYFAQGPGDAVPYFGPVVELGEGSAGVPSVGQGSSQQLLGGGAGQNAVAGSGAAVTVILGEGARE